jgi:hypothetical protein
MIPAGIADRSSRQVVQDLILLPIAYIGCLVLRPIVLVVDPLQARSASIQPISLSHRRPLRNPKPLGRSWFGAVALFRDQYAVTRRTASAVRSAEFAAQADG